MTTMIDDEFNQLWQEHKIPGWDDRTGNGHTTAGTHANGASSNGTSTTTLDTRSPLFCIPCNKLFAKESSYQSHLPGKKHTRAVAEQSSRITPQRIARLEFAIQQWTNVLEPQLTTTIKHIQTRLLQTYDELEKERALETRRIQTALHRHTDGNPDAMDEETKKANADDENGFDNPLHLPLSWDGKPIPHWMYVLHGLQQKFDCEVCGDATYRGPLAYQRHFSEWRHLYGLKCLGVDIDVTGIKPFIFVTTIKDVTALNERLKREMNMIDKTDEEMEDDQGNVYSKKVYEDMKRQGLI